MRMRVKRSTAAADGAGQRRLPILLRHSWFSLNQAFRRRLAATGITPDQYTALRTLSEHLPARLSQSELTRIIASDPNTVASLIERMEQAGFIKRLHHASDRRAWSIQLLTAGAAKYRQGRRIALALQMEVLGGWDEEKQQVFLEDLAYVAERCRAAAGAGKRKGRGEREL